MADWPDLPSMSAAEILEEIKGELRENFPHVGFALAWHFHYLTIKLGGESKTPKSRLAEAVANDIEWKLLIASAFSETEDK